jgi:hypothetical membrane protein
VAGLVAALAYSSFLLAGPLGSTLDPTTSYVSELGARTQPASVFFRAVDMVAGGLIVVLAAALRSGLARDWRRDTGTAGLVLAGAASVIDGWKPMDCTPSIDQACRLREDAMGLLGQLREPHTVSSVTGVVAAIASMAALGSLLGSDRRRRRLGLFGQVAAFVTAGLSLAELPLTTADPGVGLIERIVVLCVSAWIAALGLVLLPRRRHRPASSAALAGVRGARGRPVGGVPRAIRRRQGWPRTRFGSCGRRWGGSG